MFKRIEVDTLVLRKRIEKLAVRVAKASGFDPNQPRDPAGSATGGRWTSGGGGGSKPDSKPDSKPGSKPGSKPIYDPPHSRMLQDRIDPYVPDYFPAEDMQDQSIAYEIRQIERKSSRKPGSKEFLYQWAQDRLDDLRAEQRRRSGSQSSLTLQPSSGDLFPAEARRIARDLLNPDFDFGSVRPGSRKPGRK